MDPPRGGADSGCIESVVKHRFAKVIYVSCDPATLARDAKLLAKGGYRPVSAKLFNMFPRTARFESVTEFLSEENFSGK
jgi:23S rRNA (uracil1939-C5)-methyltransferase